MRLTNFRGMRLDNKQWVYGNLKIHNAYNLNDGIHNPEPLRAYIEEQDLQWDNTEKCWMHFTYEVDPETVGQFAGKEIYEGDIVEIIAAMDMFNDDGSKSMSKDEVYETCVVHFYQGAFWLGYKNTLKDKHLLRMIFNDGNWRGEIIGNVIENPELWENKK